MHRGALPLCTGTVPPPPLGMALEWGRSALVYAHSVMRGLFQSIRAVAPAAVLAAGAFTLSGCAAEYVMIQTAQFPEPFIFQDAIDWTREGSDAFQTLHDFETAQQAAYGSVGTLEGLHRLVPDQPNGLFLLNRSWAGIAFAFIDDEREEAMIVKNDRMVEYQKARARAAFKRARFFGEELMRLRFPDADYQAAQRNADTMTAFLRKWYTDPDHAEELMWLGASILGRVNFDMDNPEAVAEVWIGVHMLERVVELDPAVSNGTAHTILGAYYARGATGELEEGKKHFDAAMKIHDNKVLTTKLQLATRYHCFKRDRSSYVQALEEILDAPDAMPDQRLTNTMSKRKARRYLDYPKIFQRDCAFEG
jgi:hypothetical protein